MLRFYLLLISFACAYGYVLVSLQQLNSTMAALKNDTFMLTHTEDFRDHSNYIKVSRGFEPELSFTKRNQMQSTVVPNRYIVKLKESLSDIQVQAHITRVKQLFSTNSGGNILQQIPSTSGHIYSLTCSAAVLAQIKESSEVAYVEQVTILQSSSLKRFNWTHIAYLRQNFASNFEVIVKDAGRRVAKTFHAGIPMELHRNRSTHRLLNRSGPLDTVEQTDVPNWGLSRIAGTTDSTFYFPASAGQNVNIYVVDTGVDVSHQEFRTANGQASRAKVGVTLGNPGDSIGHGTHVAGIAAGLRVGVAKAANVWAQRCLDAEHMQYSDLMLACLKATITHAENQGIPAIVNLSLKTSKSNAMDDLVSEGISKGLLIVAAAGNSGEDGGACSISPAGNPMVISVGATTVNDTIANFSNTGRCIDIFAPGVEIVSAAAGTGDGYIKMSGTSMATPFVVGVAALIRSVHPQLSPAQVKELILENSYLNSIKEYSEKALLLSNRFQ